jgi:hypothetical protein
VNIEPLGTEHYPTFSQLDLHWDKAFLFGQRRISSTSSFNLMNERPCWPSDAAELRAGQLRDAHPGAAGRQLRREGEF